MAIAVQLRIEDRETEDLLAFMQRRFPDMWHGEKAYVMERAIKILRMADEYEKAETPYLLNAIKIGPTEGASLVHELPTDKHQ